MSKRFQGGVLGVGFNPLQAPNAPTIGTATSPTATTASVAFTAPANVGGSAITSYAVQSTPGGIGASGASSPITVSGLTTGTAYTFRVTALNSYGPSPISASSNSVTPVTQGQQAYTTAGTYSWVAPACVTSVSVVAVGGGGGGSYVWGGNGGALGYKNNYSVTPGNSYTVVVGAGGTGTVQGQPTPNGGDSYFVSTAVVKGGQGLSDTGTRSTYVGDGGGQGGLANGQAGGGGAGGYSGTGGSGNSGGSGGSGSGGGGGGGGDGGANYNGGTNIQYNNAVGGGGGVGLLGSGSTGSGGSYNPSPCSNTTLNYPGGGGGGGSGGAAGATGGADSSGSSSAFTNGGNGGTYGGGGGGSSQTYNFGTCAYIWGRGGNGGVGAVRIIWPGTTRSFPSTNTGNL